MPRIVLALVVLTATLLVASPAPAAPTSTTVVCPKALKIGPALLKRGKCIQLRRSGRIVFVHTR